MVLLVISEGILKESQSLNSRSAQPSSKIFKTEKNIMVPNTIAIYCQLLYCQLLYLHMPCGAKAGHMSNQFKSSAAKEPSDEWFGRHLELFFSEVFSTDLQPWHRFSRTPKFPLRWAKRMTEKLAF